MDISGNISLMSFKLVTSSQQIWYILWCWHGYSLGSGCSLPSTKFLHFWSDEEWQLMLTSPNFVPPTVRNLEPRKNCEPQTRYFFFSFSQFAPGFSQLAIWMKKYFFSNCPQSKLLFSTVSIVWVEEVRFPCHMTFFGEKEIKTVPFFKEWLRNLGVKSISNDYKLFMMIITVWKS
mgnify:CR=1 FL=1